MKKDNIDTEERLEHLEEKIDAIMLAVSGNPLTKDKGLVDRIIRLEKFVETFNKKRIYYIGYASAIIFIIGIIGGIIKASGLIVALFSKLVP